MSKMSENKTTTAVEKITLVLHSIWIYYRRELAHLIPPILFQDNLANGNAQRMLDAFPHLSRAEAGFLALAMDVISSSSVDDLLKEAETFPKDLSEDVCEDEKWLVELIRSICVNTTARPGFREELWQRMLAVLNEGYLPRSKLALP